MNDFERTLWVDNDETLYNWKRSTRLSMTAFVNQNRAVIDKVITAISDEKSK